MHIHESLWLPQEWGDALFDMPIKVGSKTVQTTFTVGAFVSRKLAASAGITHGKAFRVMKQPDGSHVDTHVVVVYGHPDVADGHLCLATDAMRQAGFTPHSQVRPLFSALFALSSPPFPLSSLSFSPLPTPLLRAGAAEGCSMATSHDRSPLFAYHLGNVRNRSCYY
jgi:hypothetical protein